MLTMVTQSLTHIFFVYFFGEFEYMLYLCVANEKQLIYKN